MKNVRRHFFSRSLFANILQLYSYKALINELSAQAYSSLHQFSALVPIFILTFMMSIKKGHIKGHVGIQILCVLTILIYMLFPIQHTVFALALFAVLNDFIGVVTYPLFVEKRCKLNMQSEMFVACNNSDMLGRIVACLVFYALTTAGLLSWISYILLPLFLIQFYGLFKMLSIPETPYQNMEAETGPLHKIKQSISLNPQ